MVKFNKVLDKVLPFTNIFLIILLSIFIYFTFCNRIQKQYCKDGDPCSKTLVERKAAIEENCPFEKVKQVYEDGTNAVVHACGKRIVYYRIYTYDTWYWKLATRKALN